MAALHFSNYLPMQLLLPVTSLGSTKELPFRTIPSASKTEIKKVLESCYGFEIEKVRTLNMQGKTKRTRGGSLIAKPDYKKAYVTLKNPLNKQQSKSIWL